MATVVATTIHIGAVDAESAPAEATADTPDAANPETTVARQSGADKTQPRMAAPDSAATGYNETSPLHHSVAQAIARTAVLTALGAADQSRSRHDPPLNSPTKHFAGLASDRAAMKVRLWYAKGPMVPV